MTTFTQQKLKNLKVKKLSKVLESLAIKEMATLLPRSLTMNTSPAIALTIIGIFCLAYGEPVVLGETMHDNGRVTGIYVLESDNLFVEKSIYHGRGMRPPFWVEVELADARGVLQRKMFRLDPGVGPVAVDDRVTVKSAALVFDRSGGLLPQVDRVTEVHPRKRDAAALSAGQ